LDVIQLGEVAVKCGNGQVTGFSRNLENETIREFDRWPLAAGDSDLGPQSQHPHLEGSTPGD
jgi:hypothetical protein